MQIRLIIMALLITAFSAAHAAEQAALDAALAKMTSYGQDYSFTVEPAQASASFYQLETQVLIKPSPVLIGGKAYLVYEMFITNVGSQPFRIGRIDLMDGDEPDKVIASYSGEGLLDMISSFQLINPDSEQSLLLRPGVREVLYFMPEFPNVSAVPNKLVHRFILQAPGSAREDFEGVQDFPMRAGTTDVSAKLPVIVGAPLQGNHWFAANGPSNTSTHRREHVTNHGVMFFPDRFAVDFIQFGANGKMYSAEANQNGSYFGYGANVYSVSSGKVIAVTDGIPDNTPGRRDYPITLVNMFGNSVLIDMGNKRYAFYAHLIPGSLKVKRGDTVQKGQILGGVGNSGNSDVPHLHFQIADLPSALSAQGVPYAFEKFLLEEYKVPNLDANVPYVIFTGKTTSVQRQLFRENDMVSFSQ